MVEPSSKKEAIKYLRDTYNVSVGRLCEIMRLSRSNYYYKSKLDDSEIIAKLLELAEKRPTRGFENYYHRIRKEGYKWAWSRVLRVYRNLGLVRRTKRRKRLPEELRKPLYQPDKVNEVWSMDFMSDSLSDGRTFRVLNVIDDYNRECLINKGSLSYPSRRVIRELETMIEIHGKPAYIRTDNGPEFISHEYKNWCDNKGIIRVYSEPGKPMQNGYVERFNRTFREDILDAYLFSSISQFNIIADKWAFDYNDNHPHGSLENKSPREFGQRAQNTVGLIPQYSDY